MKKKLVYKTKTKFFITKFLIYFFKHALETHNLDIIEVLVLIFFFDGRIERDNFIPKKINIKILYGFQIIYNTSLTNPESQKSCLPLLYDEVLK